MRQSSKPTAFVLSGGASLGAIQVGMLHALYERRIEPDFIVGASAGALNGAFIAARSQSVATADELAEVWIDLRRGNVFPLNPLTGLFGFAGLRRHMVPDSGLRALIARHMSAERLEELATPLHVIATDVLTGSEVRLSRGPLRDAILASAAIPGVLPSIEWGGRALMDGGVANNTPISHAIELGARRIYVLPTAQSCELEAAPTGALGMVVHATNLLVHRRLVDDVVRYRDTAELIVLPSPCPVRVQPMDFSQAESLIDQARDESRRWLDRYEDRNRGKDSAPAVAKKKMDNGSIHAMAEATPGSVVTVWREERLRLAGFDRATASRLATDETIDFHALLDLVDRGAPPHLAARILAPLEGERDSR